MKNFKHITLSNLNKKLLLTSTVLLIFTFALNMNLLNEITSGGFPGRILSFININLFLENYNIFSPKLDNNFYINNLQSIAEYLPALAIIFTILSQVTGTSPQYLMLIPFGVFFTSLSYYTLFKSFFNNFKIAFLSMIYVLIYTLTSSDQIGGYVAAWTFILFTLFILISYKILEKKTPSLIIVLLALYLGLHLFWHTMEAKTLFFIFSLNVVIFILKNKNCKIGLSSSNTSHILLVMFIISIYFKKLLYKDTGYLASISLNSLIQSYFDWFLIIGAKIGIVSIEVQSKSIYYYTQSSNITIISTYAGLALVLIIMIPILISCTIDIIFLIKNNYVINSRLIYIKWALLISQIVLMVAYGLAGGAGPGLIIHFFPIASIIGLLNLKSYYSKFYLKNKKKIQSSQLESKIKFESLNRIIIFIIKKILCKLNKIEGRRIISLFMILIICMNLLYSSPFILNIYNQTNVTYEDSSTVSDWIINKTEFSHNMSQLFLADFKTVGKLLVLFSEKGLLFNYKSFNPSQYQIIIENKLNNTDWNYMIINLKLINEPIGMDQGWNRLKPISHYIDIIESNDNLNKVYNDNLFAVYLQKDK